MIYHHRDSEPQSEARNVIENHRIDMLLYMSVDIAELNFATKNVE